MGGARAGARKAPAQGAPVGAPALRGPGASAAPRPAGAAARGTASGGGCHARGIASVGADAAPPLDRRAPGAVALGPQCRGGMVAEHEDGAGADAELVALAEELRRTVGDFVRGVRGAADTPSAAWSDTLGELDRRGPMTVAALARLRRVRHQSMRLVVARLEADGLVARTPDASDARGQVVAATEAGRAALAASRAARTRRIADGLRRHASADERRAVATALAVLRRLSTPD